MISLAEISSKKNVKRPDIVAHAFLNSSGIVWRAGHKLSRLLMKSDGVLQ